MAAKKTGRPQIEWSQALENELVDRIISGEHIVSIFRDSKFPERSTFYLKCARDESFRTRIAHARKQGALAQFDEFIGLSDESDAENYNAIKVRLWARTWALARMNPAELGDKSTVTHDGELSIKTVLVQPRTIEAKERPLLKPSFDDELE